MYEHTILNCSNLNPEYMSIPLYYCSIIDLVLSSASRMSKIIWYNWRRKLCRWCKINWETKFFATFITNNLCRLLNAPPEASYLPHPTISKKVLKLNLIITWKRSWKTNSLQLFLLGWSNPPPSFLRNGWLISL